MKSPCRFSPDKFEQIKKLSNKIIKSEEDIVYLLLNYLQFSYNNLRRELTDNEKIEYCKVSINYLNSINYKELDKNRMRDTIDSNIKQIFNDTYNYKKCSFNSVEDVNNFLQNIDPIFESYEKIASITQPMTNVLGCIMRNSNNFEDLRFEVLEHLYNRLSRFEAFAHQKNSYPTGYNAFMKRRNLLLDLKMFETLYLYRKRKGGNLISQLPKPLLETIGFWAASAIKNKKLEIKDELKEVKKMEKEVNEMTIEDLFSGNQDN